MNKQASIEMASNSRMSAAVHVLALLASKDKTLLTSAEIAERVSTNPVVIRRLMRPLRRANIVRSRGGAGGGWELVGKADAISLLAVWKAVECDDVIAFDGHRPNPLCPIGRNIEEALRPAYRHANKAAERELRRVTLGSLLDSTRRSTKRISRSLSRKIAR